MFIPTTPEELTALNWPSLDVILVSGDTYIDSPYNGIALIGRQLLADGFRVGIIAQPDIHSPQDITRLGEPSLFWGVSAGAVDSLVANTTALGKPRRTDDYTPGGLNDRRPDRACIVYSNLIRHYFKGTVPIVLGGVEASLRRVVHYDFWSDALRRSILLDAKADYLLYGMADLSVLQLARILRDGRDPTNLHGLCYAASSMPEGYMELPSYEKVQTDKAVFTSMFHQFYQNNDPITAKGLAQRYADRYVVQNPPAAVLTTAEMDAVYGLPFEYDVHPYYAAMGEVRAMDTIRFSIPTHRGCYGECNFCAIAVHEGRRVSWRSQESILAEARSMRQRPGFTGIISDLSGPTANMYGFECKIKGLRGACQDKSCIYPEVCPLLGLTHQPQTKLLQELGKIEGVRKVFIGSGIRHDLVMADTNYGDTYLEELVGQHVSGQLKLAPEHSQESVLTRMRKPGTTSLLSFKHRFESISENLGKDQYLTYYLIAAYPGCTEKDMIALQQFAGEKLGVLPEQVQIFTPTPSTYASLMYYTERDPFTGEPLFVEKSVAGKMKQKALITGWRDKKRSIPHAVEPERSSQKPVDRADYPRFGDSSRYPAQREAFPQQTGGESSEVRVIRDDYGDFFNNKPPKGWQEHRRRPAERQNASRHPEGRPEGKRANTSYPQKTGSDSRESYQSRDHGDKPAGERPYRKPSTWTNREKTQGSAKSEHPAEERPYRKPSTWTNREKTQGSARSEHPAGERPYHKPGTWTGKREQTTDRSTKAPSQKSAGRKYSERCAADKRGKPAGKSDQWQSGNNKTYQPKGRPNRNAKPQAPSSGQDQVTNSRNPTQSGEKSRKSAEDIHEG